MQTIDDPSINWPRCFIILRKSINEESVQQCVDLVKKCLDDANLDWNYVSIIEDGSSYCLSVNVPFFMVRDQIKGDVRSPSNRKILRAVGDHYIEVLEPLEFIEEVSFGDMITFG